MNEKKYNQPQSARASLLGRFGGAILLIFLFTSCDQDRHHDWKYVNQQWFEMQRQRIDTETGERFWQETESGLLYRIVNRGIGGDTFEYFPSIRSAVSIRYYGTMLNGNRFDSNANMTGAVGSFVPGFTEALQKLRRNAIIQVIIPYHLAYGDQGMGITIPPYSVLQFEIELHNFWTN